MFHEQGTQGEDVSPGESERGALAPHAASVLMKLLYAARIARFDLLRSINSLARNVTKWTIDDDAKLYHLMCYVNSSLSKRMTGWVGDKFNNLTLSLFADADFAGCAQSLRSTSGSHMHIQGNHTRFPLSGGSKRQGCVSHSTPEAEIVAADVTLRTMGLPAMSIWETLTGKSPKLLFHDDNQGMIGVVRSGRNPTMRHLERIHGIAITSLHEHFTRENYVLMYEVTSKMAADIHTKGFKNPLAWRRACMLINLLDPGDIGTRDLLDMVSPTTDVDTTVRQVFQTKTHDIPNFPYTEIPILPPEVYQKGLSGKEQVQQLPGMDPILVVKTPTFFRKRPPGVSLPHDCLRSTWILSHGKWIKVEDRAPPVQQQDRFDQWVERACFQHHPHTLSISPSVVTKQQAGIVSPGHPASTARPGPHAAVPTRQTQVRKYPQLTVGMDQLFCHQSHGNQPTTIHAAPCGTARVINTLLRVVHGGSSGWGSLPTGFPPTGDPNDDPYPTENKDPNRGRIVLAGGDVMAGRVSRDKAYNPMSSSRRGERMSKDENNQDEWVWKDEITLTRIHKVPRRKMVTPKEADFLPCKLKRFRDERETNQIFQSNGRVINDSWRLAGNNIERTNKRNEFWTGTTTFKIISNADINDVLDSGSDVEDRASCQDTVVTCTFDGNMKIIPLDDMFIAHHYKLKHETRDGKDWDIRMTLHRKNGKILTYHFRQSYADFLGRVLGDYVISLELHEMKDNVPCLLLVCAETQSIITNIHRHDRFKMMHVVTITEDDNLMSNYGRAKWRRCIRGSSDCVFFAGPCTGGSPWNRLNKNVSEVTAHNIRMKAFLYWELWEEFTVCLQHVHDLHAMALLELPRGCDYWNDDRMKFLINGTQSTVHDFDGCMYGLKSKFKDVGTAIKKPWRIVSWGVKFSDLHAKCDGSHDHGQCAGRETRATQLYTEKIVKCILRSVKNQMLINNAYVRKYQPSSTDGNNHRNHSKSCACIIVRKDECEIVEGTSLERRLIHFITQRGGLKVKLRLNPRRGSLSVDPDSVRGRLKVKLGDYPRRGCALTDPDFPCLVATIAMAGNDLVIPPAARGINSLRSTLSLIKEKNQEHKLPKAFSTYEESNHGGCKERDIDAWLNSVKISPPVVVALAFVMDRSDRSFVTHAIRLLMKMMSRVTNEDEMGMSVTSFIDKGARLSKLVEQSARNTDEQSIMQLLCTFECAIRIDEFWETLKDHYTGLNSMITKEITVRELRDKIANTSPMNLGSLNQTYPPYGSSCQQIRQRTNFEEIARRKWESWSFEAMRREEPDRRVVADRIRYLVNIMYEESYSLGYALRRHNARMASSQGKPIIVQNVLEDWMSMRYDLSIERTAAVVHLQTLLMISKMLHEWMDRLQNFSHMASLSDIIKTDLDRMKQAIDLRGDLWEVGGYNIERADQGMFEEVEKRNRTFSCIRDYITTTATTQMGQGASEVTHIDGWDIPLMPKDGRNPPSQPDHPAWDPSPIKMMNDQQQREADAQRAQQQQQTGHHSSTAGGRDDPSSASGSAAPKPPPSKPRPSTPPPRKDWVIPRVPDGYKFRTSSMPDQRNSEFITSAWMDDNGHSYCRSFKALQLLLLA